MRRFVLGLAAALACIAGMGENVAHAQGSPTFVYTSNNVDGSNTVTGFRVESNGTLTDIGTVSTGGSGSGGGLYAANRATVCGTRLYVSNDGDSTISAFNINPVSGALGPIGIFTSSGGNGISLDCTPNGQYLVAAYYGSRNIALFAITANGSLIQVGAAALPGSGADGIKVSPDGRFLAVVLVDLDAVEM